MNILTYIRCHSFELLPNIIELFLGASNQGHMPYVYRDFLPEHWNHYGIDIQIYDMTYLAANVAVTNIHKACKSYSMTF